MPSSVRATSLLGSSRIIFSKRLIASSGCPASTRRIASFNGEVSGEAEGWAFVRLKADDCSVLVFFGMSSLWLLLTEIGLLSEEPSALKVGSLGSAFCFDFGCSESF